KGSVAPVEVLALLPIEPGLLDLALGALTRPLEHDRRELPGLLLLAPSVRLGLEERVILERICNLVALQRLQRVEMSIPPLQRQMLLDHGREKRLSLRHSTTLGCRTGPQARATIPASTQSPALDHLTSG